MDAKQLPARPSLDQYRKQAKDLFKARKESESVQRIKCSHPRFNKLAETDIANAELSLADAQCVIAREHAFESWPKFAKHIQEMFRADSPVSRFERAADAIISGDLATLKSVLARHPELVRSRSTREHNAPLIHYVAANGVENFRQKTPQNITEITRTLLAAGAEVDATTQAYGSASTALGLAATSYHPAKAGVQLALLDLLLLAGANIDGATGGWNSVIAALHNGRGAAAEFLAKRGARLDLESAAGTGRVEAMAKYINPGGTLRDGATAAQLNYGFIWACEYGHPNVVEFLLNQNVQLDANLVHGQSGLHWAAYGGHLEIVDLLLNAKAPLNVKDKIHNGTPLGWAIYSWAEPPPESKNARYHEVVEHLVQAGAIVDWKWIESLDRGSPVATRLRSDQRMLNALGPKNNRPGAA